MFGLLSHFRFVDGGDVGKKKREQLSSLLQSGAVAPSAVMIGDRAVDILAAHDNGLRGVGVLWGFGDRPELAAAGAEVILESVGQLAELAG